MREQGRVYIGIIMILIPAPTVKALILDGKLREEWAKGNQMRNVMLKVT